LFAADRFKELVVDQSGDCFLTCGGTGCIAKKSGKDHVNGTCFTAQDVGFGDDPANGERSDVEGNSGAIAINRCVIEDGIGNDVRRRWHSGKVTECCRDALLAEFFGSSSRLLDWIVVRRGRQHRKYRIH
jgi:hypothetical protein